MSVNGGWQSLGHSSCQSQQRRLKKQNSKHSFAYLLIFFGGLPEQASEFTSAISPPDCKYIWGQQNLLYSLCKWHNQCRTEGLLSECWLTLKHSGRASHSLCRTERVFMLTHCPSICGKAGLLETSGTSRVKTDTALCLARYSAQSKRAYSFEWG